MTSQKKCLHYKFEKPYTQFYGYERKTVMSFLNCLSNFFGSELPSGCRVRIRRAAAIRRRRRRSAPPPPRGSHCARRHAAAAGKIGTDKVLEIASSLALGLG